MKKEFNKTQEMLKMWVQGKKLLKYAKNKVKRKILGLNFGTGRRKIHIYTGKNVVYEIFQ